MKKAPYVSQHKLRLLAARAVEVVTRNAHVDPTVAASGSYLLASARAFIASYDEARRFQSQRGAEMEQGRAAVETLQIRIRAWVGMLLSDIRDFRAMELDGSLAEPDHLFADAKRIIETVQVQGSDLPYTKDLVDDLTAVSERARSEWAQARAAMVKLQELGSTARADAVELQKRLVSFRRTVKAILGTSHRDYQILRSSRSSDAAEEKKTVEPAVVVDELLGDTEEPENDQFLQEVANG